MLMYQGMGCGDGFLTPALYFMILMSTSGTYEDEEKRRQALHSPDVSVVYSCICRG